MVVGAATGGLVGDIAGEIVGGAVGAEVAGAGASQGEGAAQATAVTLSVPVCAGCRARTGHDASGHLAAGDSVEVGSTVILGMETEQDCVVVTFQNGNYAKQFRAVNEGRVFDSVPACLAQPDARSAPAVDPGRNERVARLAALPSCGLLPLSEEHAVHHLLKSYLPQAGLFVAPDIPPKKLANACAAARVPAGEGVVALIDCTCFGSAKNCLVFCSQALHYHLEGGVHSIPYREFPDRTFKVGALLIAGQIEMDRGESMNISGSSVPRDKAVDMLMCLKELMNRRAAPAASQGPAEGGAMARPAPRPGEPPRPPGLDDAIIGLLRVCLPQSDLFVAPDIPAKKLGSAMAQCRLPEGERVLGLIDCTVFGSAKDCVVFGGKGLYYHLGGSTRPAGAGVILYEDFASREFAPGTWSQPNIVHVGHGQQLDTTGTNVPKKKTADILLGIQRLVIQQARG